MNRGLRFKTFRPLLLHLPLSIAVAVMVVFSTDIEAFRPLKTEHTYGLWVVVLVPIAVFALLAQIAIWVVLAARTSSRSPE